MTTKNGAASQLDEIGGYACQAIDGSRNAAYQVCVPNGLLGRAEYYSVRGRRDDGNYFNRARRDVDEAMTIAKRSKMRLHECDCHLEYARLHLAQGEKAQAHEHFKTARAMVHQMGYHRPDTDLAELDAQL